MRLFFGVCLCVAGLAAGADQASAQSVADPGAAETAQAAAPAVTPAWKPTLTLGGYLQGELDAGASGDSRFPTGDRFFVRRARLTASGEAAHNVAYRLQGEFGAGLGTASGATASLTDGYVEWTIVRAAHVRFGQFKSPYGREWLVSSAQLVTIERALVSDRLTLNRQVGAAVIGDAAGGRLGYQAAMFNGNGRNTSVNDNRDFMYVVRGTAVPWQPTKATSVEVGANAFWSRDTKLSMPKEFGLDSTPDTQGEDNLFTGRHRGAGLDAHLQHGIWDVDAEWLHVRFEPDAAPAPDVTSEGWYATPSAFVYKRLVQLVGRYEWYRPDVHVADNETSAWTAGLNYYARGNSAKLMVDYLWIKTPSASDRAKLLACVQVTF